MWFLDHVHELRTSTPRRRLPTIATAYLVAPPSGGRALVRLWDGETASVPAQPGVYDGISTVSVQVDDHGRPVLVFGPTTSAPVAAPEKSPESRASVPDAPESPKVSKRSTTIYPSASGTFSTKYGTWGSWGASWEGHPYSAGQGSIFGSGPLIGAGFYGNAVKALGASRITSVRVRIIGAAQGTGWTPVLRGTTNGSTPSGAPTYSSTTTATGPSLGWKDTGWVTLPSAMREDLRTGATKGLALVGSSYGVTRGKGTSGLALAIAYEVTA